LETKSIFLMLSSKKYTVCYVI